MSSMLTLAVVKSLAIDYHWPQSMTLSASVLWNHSYNLRRFCTLPIWSSFEYHFGKHKSESSILSCGQEMQQMRETCAIQVWAALKKEQHCETTKSWVALNRWFNHFAWLIAAFLQKMHYTANFENFIDGLQYDCDWYGMLVVARHAMSHGDGMPDFALAIDACQAE